MPLKIRNILILFYLLDVVVLCHSHSENNAQCSYNRSVKVSPNANGFYIYDGVEIPSTSVFTYNYTILENGTRVATDNYTRGCICDVKKCLRVCSPSFLQFYNNRSDKDIIDFGYTKNVTLRNDTVRAFHLVHDFYHVVDSVCEHSYSLDVELEPNLMWTLYENGTLFRHGDRRYLSPDDYCFDVKNFEEDGELYFLVNPHNCDEKPLPWTVTFNAYAMMFSVPFFLLSIVSYCCVPHLRKDYGECFICYLCSLTVSYTLISFVTLNRGRIPPGPCKAIGYIIYYTVIAYLTWSCVISYDTWNSFSNLLPKRSFVKYSIAGWSVPMLMTILTYLAQNSNLDESLKPGIDDHHCGANTNKWSACIYFYVPGIVVFIYSLISYIGVLRCVTRYKRSVSKYESNTSKSDRQRVFLYLRLFIFMGVSWIFEILSYFLRMMVEVKMVIFNVPDFFYASQGIVIFLMFICHQQVLTQIRIKLTGRQKRGHQIISMQMDSY